MINRRSFRAIVGVVACLMAATAAAGIRGGKGCQPSNCGCEEQHCPMVEKKVPCTVYEPVEEKRLETEYETVYDTKVVTDVRKYPVTTYSEVPYTVNRPVVEYKTRDIQYFVNTPVYEPRSRVVNYTVHRPVYETRTRTIRYTTYRVVHEPRTRVINYTIRRAIPEVRTGVRHYTVYRPSYETRSRTVTYYVHRPIYETHTRQVPYTTYTPVYEKRMRNVPYTVTEIVPEKKVISVNTGHWETRKKEIPGPVITRCVQSPGTWEWDPCTCRCVYCPGPVKEVKVQCPPRTVCEEVWVPRVEQKTIETSRCVYTTKYRQVEETYCRMQPEVNYRAQEYTVCRYVSEPKTRTDFYTVVRHIPEPRTQEYSYTVYRYINEPHTRTVNFTVARVIPEPQSYEQTYTVVRMVPETHSRVHNFTVARMIREPRTQTQTYAVTRMVPETHTRQVPQTTWKTEPIERTITVPRTVAHKVEVCVTRMVKKTVYKTIMVPQCSKKGPSQKSGKGDGGSLQEGQSLETPSIDSTARRNEASLSNPATTEVALRSEMPRTPTEYFQDGLSAFQFGNYEDALSGFERAVNAAPNKSIYRYYLAASQRRVGKTEAADKTLSEATTVELEHPVAAYGRLMERVQGQDRVWIEEARQKARRAARD